MPKVTGKLTDFGYDAMPDSDPQLQFRYNTPGVTGASLLTTKPVIVEPEYNAYFEVDLVASSAVMPAGFYTITIRYRDTVTRQWVSETLPWRLAVPAAGGRISDLLRTSLNPSLAPGAEPPVPAEWWQAEMSTTFENAAQTLTEAADARLAELSASVTDAITATQTPEMPNAVGEWWIHPLATYQSAPYPRTVFGAISETGDILACEFNHGTGKKTRHVVGRAAYVDDHNVPALWVEEGHRPVLIWTNHTTDDDLRIKVGSLTGDLGSLASAPEQTITLAKVAYAQIHHIRARSTDRKTVLWIFTRRGYHTWSLVQASVDRATGKITKDWDRQIVNGEGRQTYLSTADAHGTGDQIIRVGVCFNPEYEDNMIYYFEINTATGVVSGKPNANILTNSAMPMNPKNGDAAPPMVAQTPATHDRRFFYTRPGPDEPAVAYADWPVGKEEQAQYKVAVRPDPVADPFSGFVPDGGSVETILTAAAGAKLAAGFTADLFVQLPADLGDLEWRIGTFNDPFYRFRIYANGTRNIRATTNIQAVSNTSNAATFAALAGQRVGLRLTADIATQKLRSYYSTDNGTSWTQIGTLGSDLPAGSTGFILPTDQPVTISGAAAVVERFELRAPNNAVVLSSDFAAWQAGAVERTTGGTLWTVTSPGYIASTTPRQPAAKNYTFGTSGPGVDSSGTSPSYIAGMAFENPSYDGVVITAHSAAGTETVRKHRLAAAGYVAEILRQQPTAEGRLIRPYPPINGGPVPALLTEITAYQSFTKFEGNILTT